VKNLMGANYEADLFLDTGIWRSKSGSLFSRVQSVKGRNGGFLKKKCRADKVQR
jgi:hypothetical protein